MLSQEFVTQILPYSLTAAMAFQFPYERVPIARQELWWWMMVHLFNWILYFLLVFVTMILASIQKTLSAGAWMFWYGQEYCKECNWPETQKWFHLHMELIAWYAYQCARLHNWLCHVFAQYLGVAA